MRPDKELALKYGIPPAQRRYVARYGAGVEQMIQDQKKFPAPVLDHWRDRDPVNRPLPYGART